jgi:perosamine synthetase
MTLAHRSAATVQSGAIMRGRSLHTPLLTQTRWVRNAQRDAWSFPGAALSIWHSARVALWQGVRALGLSCGDRVLVPAYCCGVEVTTLLAAGLRVDYYRILPDLTPDLEQLAELCRSPARGLLVIHYFGLPQPIHRLAAFARERGLILMEDCAHGLFARQTDGAALGSCGDLAVFSLKKHLPVPNGGLLVLRRSSMRNGVPRPTRPHLGPTAKNLAYLAAIELEHRWPRANDSLRRLLRRPGALDIRDPCHGDPADRVEEPAIADGRRFDPERGAWGASRLTRVLYRRADPEDIRSRRARHYRTLLESVGDDDSVRPLCTEVQGASPWLFPVLAEAPADLRRHLWANRAAAVGFWRSGHPAIPRHLFPFEDRLRRHVVALPVHQGLSPAEVARIGEVLRRYSSRR